MTTEYTALRTVNNMFTIGGKARKIPDNFKLRHEDTKEYDNRIYCAKNCYHLT